MNQQHNLNKTKTSQKLLGPISYKTKEPWKIYKLWELQQHSQANKQTKLWRYFTIQTVRQNMPFILWSVQYATCSMLVKTRHYSTLNWISQKSAKDPKAILADKHFQRNGDRSNQHTRFTITDRLTKTNLDKEHLTQRENFGIQKIETIYPEG